MLSVVTLWIVFAVNFFALGVVWFYVARSYPNFQAARFWGAAAFLASLGAAISVLREFISPLIPLLIAGTMLIACCALINGGVQRFYDLRVSWVRHVGLVVLSFLGMSFFIWQQSAPMRVVVFSTGLSIAIGATVRLVFSRPAGTQHPGARLAGIIGGILLSAIMLRAVLMLTNVNGDINLVRFSATQAILVLALVFLSIAWNFGFLLMAIDRLRTEVEQLAMVDDLTSVANRRQLLARLTEECARSDRTLEPFVLLLIDLDRFKLINDGFGHTAGDTCLRLFARALQERLRTGDLLARMGGDEFCAVLPSTTLREGEIVARQLVEVGRACNVYWNGTQIPLSCSIGVAQWRPDMGKASHGLVVAADFALYAAKAEGRDRHAVADDQAAEALMLKSA
ncbi:MAG: GGDEF domain-containing protein [Xanthobacteraceae bacterium]|nr:GGDEF domain-containing protein [Xanthobacteraceae bacterium]